MAGTCTGMMLAMPEGQVQCLKRLKASRMKTFVRRCGSLSGRFGAKCQEWRATKIEKRNVRVRLAALQPPMAGREHGPARTATEGGQGSRRHGR
jgi:hypothetical protein